MEKKTAKAPNFISSVGLLLGGVMYTSVFLISTLRAFNFGYPNLAYASLFLAAFGFVMIGLGARKFLRWLKYQPEGTGPVVEMKDLREQWKNDNDT